MWIKKLSWFPPIQTDALTIVLLLTLTLKVRGAALIFYPISSSKGMYGIGGFCVCPLSTSWSRSPLGTAFWSIMLFRALWNTGRQSSAPKKLLGLRLANCWHCCRGDLWGFCVPKVNLSVAAKQRLSWVKLCSLWMHFCWLWCVCGLCGRAFCWFLMAESNKNWVTIDSDLSRL